MLPDLEKHIAGDVLGGCCVVHEPEHETVDSQMMTRVEELHGASVAGGDAFYEPFIGNVVIPVDAMGGKL
jgi:hypothetical protein